MSNSDGGAGAPRTRATGSSNEDIAPRLGPRPQNTQPGSQPSSTGHGHNQSGPGFGAGLILGGIAAVAAGALVGLMTDFFSPKSEGQMPQDGTIDVAARTATAGDAPAGEECVLCLSAAKTHAFVPCGHMACCAGCVGHVTSGKIRACPVCRAALRDSLVIRVYQ